MTYFSLRKRDPEPEPDEVDETVGEEAEDAEEEQPTSVVAALGAAISGPGRWLTARFNLDTAIIVHAFAVFSIFYYGGWIAAGIAFAWLFVALMFVPREHLERAVDALERLHTADPDDAPEAVDEAPMSPLVTLMWFLIGDAPGVHVKTLAERLQAAAPQERTDQAAMKAAVKRELAALNIPVRGSVRDAAGRVNEGVHRDDLSVWEQALPDSSPAAPSELRSGAVATAVTWGVGDRRKAVATPLSRLRRLLSGGVA